MDQLTAAVIAAAIAFGSALLGAVAGYLGAVQLHIKDVQAQQRGAARAVYYEVRRNAAMLGGVLAEPMLPIPLDRSSFESCIAVLANFLTPAELEAVTLAYIQHENVLRVIAGMQDRRSVDLMPDEKGLLTIMLQQQLAARDVLMLRGFDAAERQQLADHRAAQMGL